MSKITKVVITFGIFMYLVFGVALFAHAQDESTIGAGTVTDSNTWVEDKEVSAVGAAAARSREVLNWALAIDGAGFSAGTSPGATSPQTQNLTKTLADLWGKVRNLVSIAFVVMLIIISFGLILRTDWGTRSRRLLPFIIISLIIMNFSFLASATIVRLTDKLQQGFYYIANPKEHLTASNLLTVHYDYQNFKGYRLAAFYAEDSVRNHLWLVRLTTYTNYTIALILIIRIVILWGLVIFSPFLFPFLIFPATRRVAVVWVREFFRWLFIGPLLALFLSSVAYIWQKTSFVPVSSPDQESGIPIKINTEYLGKGETEKNKYYSGTNLLLAPPGGKATGLATVNQTGTGANQKIDVSGGENLTDTDTYVRFIIALIMLWAAIILPFLLLRMALVMVSRHKTQISKRWDRSSTKRYLSNLQQRFTPPIPPVKPKPTPPGLARPIAAAGVIRLPKTLEKQIPAGQTIATREKVLPLSTTKTISSEEREKELSVSSIMRLSGLTQVVPQVTEIVQAKDQKLEKIAQIEQDNEKVATSREIIERIAQPQKIEDAQEVRRYENINNMISSLSTVGATDARRFQKAITNNIYNYTVTNINQEIEKNTAKNFSQYIQKFLSSDKANVVVKVSDYLANVARIAFKPIMQITSKEQNTAVEAARNLENPQRVSNPNEKNDYQALHEAVSQGVKSGDKDAANLDYTGKLLVWSKDASDKNIINESINRKILERSCYNDKDFAKTKDIWKKHYLEAPVPISEKIKDRKQWLTQEKAKLASALEKILSSDPEQRKAGLEEVKKVTFFMLIGDYSLVDIAKYLMAKIAAIDDVIKDLESAAGQKETEDVLVPVKKKEEQHQALAQESGEGEDNDKMKSGNIKENIESGNAAQ